MWTWSSCAPTTSTTSTRSPTRAAVPRHSCPSPPIWAASSPASSTTSSPKHCVCTTTHHQRHRHRHQHNHLPPSATSPPCTTQASLWRPLAPPPPPASGSSTATTTSATVASRRSICECTHAATQVPDE